MPQEYVISNVHNDAWVCPCGNDVMSDGFGDVQIVKVNQAYGDSKTGAMLTICQSCGRLIDPDTIERNPESDGTDEWSTHRVRVVGRFPEEYLMRLFDFSDEV